MYLREFSITNFRSCSQVTVPLRPDLTLLVGENNAGKSNVVDALRLATSPLSGRRTRYFEVDDRTHGEDGPVLLTSRFAQLSRFQRAHLIGALDLNDAEAVHATRFRPPDGQNPRGRVEHLAGAALGPDPEPEARDRINHVYLAPLRDAQRELGSASGSRLAMIMAHLVEDSVREDFVRTAKDHMEELGRHAAVTTISGRIQSHLGNLTSPVRAQRVGAGFEAPDPQRLARSLRLRMAEHGADLADLAATGLGYANLLFMATVILELQNAADSELTLFLVEEPEAHLHPQLQAVLLDFLHEQAKQSAGDDSAGPAGRIQVVATSHSPNLASAVDIANVVVLRSEREGHESAASAPARTVAIPVAAIGLGKDERRKINQYLDVTRAELLFTRRVVLVEGVAEAVVLPVLARWCVFAGESADAARWRRAFLAVSLVSVGSVDFRPYLKLLLSAPNGHPVADQVVVVTDADPPVVPQAQSQATEAGSPDGGQEGGYNRASDLRALGEALGAGSRLLVAEAPHTLEADLLVPGSGNAEVLRDAYLRQHPNSAHHWQAIEDTADPAQAFHARLRAKGKFISKGEFAHDVACLIAEGRTFACPDYLEMAIKSAVGHPDVRG